MTRALALALGVVAAGCDSYAHVSRVNAPGNVPDLDAPVEHENGDPRRPQPVDITGATEDMLWVVPYQAWGRGRNGHDATETGVELRYEHHTLEYAGDSALDKPTWIVSAGTAIEQTSTNHPTLAPGALFAELGVRAFSGEVGPVEIGAGPVVYLDDHAVGAQVTARLWMLIPVRFRYTDHGGFEVMAGLQIPVAFVFGSSR
jgi:hypothetical protein